MPDWTFRDEWQSAEVNVPRAALLIAREIGYPALDTGFYLNWLSELAELASDHLSESETVVVQAEQLSDFFFGSLGFNGNQSDYYDPRNSFLNEVLERRLGLPISLSVLYVDIATRLGLPAYGIGLPGHFIVGIRDGDEAHWLDPFHGGCWLTLNDCAEIIQIAVGYEGPLDAAWFLPTSSREIVARMIHNLRSTYVHRQEWSKAAAAIRLLRMIQPNTAEHLRDLGLVYFREQSLPRAAYFLNEYLTRSPNAADATTIRQGMKEALDHWAPLN